MVKFKVGDKVRIADGITGKNTGINENKMKEFYGKVFTVDDIGTVVGDRQSDLKLAEDALYDWNADWLTLVDSEKESDLTEAQWEDFIAGKLLVNCPTKCAAETFMKKCEQRGLHWTTSGNPTSKTLWEVYGCDTVYDCDAYGMMYGKREWFAENMPNIPMVSFTTEELCRADCTVIISTHGDVITVKYVQDNCIISEETMTADAEDSLPSVCHMALNQLFPEETFTAFQEKQESQPEWTPKFHVGDIVQVVNEDYWVKPGMRGVVKVEAISASDQCGVDFGAAYTGEGLTLDDVLTAETGWWMEEEDLRKIR